MLIICYLSVPSMYVSMYIHTKRMLNVAIKAQIIRGIKPRKPCRLTKRSVNMIYPDIPQI